MPNPIPVAPDFGLWLRALRARHALTQSALAERVGVSTRTISAWEAGTSRPFSRSLHLLVAATHVPIDTLLALEPERAPFASLRHDRRLEREDAQRES